MAGKRETSPLKAAANRVNAQRSTGPRSPEGKTVASRNALRHGLLSRACFMLGEDSAALDALRAELLAAVAPVGAIEELLTDQLVGTVWRLRRAQGMESGTLGGAFLEHLPGAGFAQARIVARSIGRDEDQQPQDAMMESAAAGQAARKDTDGMAALERVARYGAGLERGLFRTLHEIERVQARRMGQNVPLPLALDVTVDTLAAEPH